MVQFSIILVIIVCLAGLVSTLLLGGKSDKGYNDAAKKNITNLTLIYIVTIAGALIALGLFVIKIT